MLDCFQPCPKPTMPEIILEAAYKRFKIESAEDKCDLQALFDFYTDIVIKERFIQAFSTPKCKKEGDINDR